MANISVVVRKVNKGIAQPVNVRYSHPDSNGKSKDFFIPCDVSVDPAKLKKGRVVDEKFAPEANAKISAVLERLDYAKRLAEQNNAEPTVEAVKRHYKALPAIKDKVDRLFDTWEEEGKSKIEILQHEIEELKNQIKDKQNQIKTIEKEIYTYEGMGKLIDRFIQFKLDQVPKNTKKKSKKSFSKSTENQYLQLKKQLDKFNPELSIKDVDKVMLESFESFLVAERYYNSSTFTLMVKLLVILNHYQSEFELDKSYKSYEFLLPMRDESVIYLTTEELKAFRNVKTDHSHPLIQKAAERAKDLALLMSETGLRYSDSAIAQSDIVGGYIIKDQKKTGGKVYIPFTKRLDAICNKYSYKLKGGKIDNFNNTFRRLLSTLNIPSLQQEVTVWNYIGDERVPDTRPKWQHCGAHTLRRTMINQCLLRNLRYDQITKLTGHKNFDAFQEYIDRDTKVDQMDEVFDFLNEIEESAMKVVA